MKNLLLIAAIVFAAGSFKVAHAHEHSAYDSLASVQAVATEPACPYRDETEDRLEKGNRRTDRDRQSSPGRDGKDRTHLFGWAGPIPYNGLADTAPEERFVTSNAYTAKKPRRVGKTGSGHEIDKTEGDELPFIDKAGDTNRNYCIMLTAEWCAWCKKMYKEIEELRDKGYRVYVLDIDDYPDLKDKLNRLDPDAPEIGAGAPYIIIRDKGKTKKVFRGFTKAEKIAPHLKHYNTQLKEEADAEKEDQEKELYDLTD